MGQSVSTVNSGGHGAVSQSVQLTVGGHGAVSQSVQLTVGVMGQSVSQ